MRVRFADGKSRSVSDEAGKIIQNALMAGVEQVMIGGDFYKASVIMSITADSSPAGMTSNMPRLVGPTTMLTEQQRESNLARIGEMQRKFLERR